MKIEGDEARSYDVVPIFGVRKSYLEAQSKSKYICGVNGVGGNASILKYNSGNVDLYHIIENVLDGRCSLPG